MTPARALALTVVPAARPPWAGAMIGLQAFVAAANVAYWALWYGGGRALVMSRQSEAYVAFENAFFLGDAWLGFSCAAGAWSLWRRRPVALLWVLVASSAGIYLGLLDLLFDLQSQARGDPAGPGRAVDLIIIALALSLGALGLRWAWRHRIGLLRAPTT